MAKSSFFKVFFANQSSTKLSIPPAFRKHLEAETSNKVSLKGPSGSRWKVGMVRDCDGLYFENGWNEFVTDQSLETGDFLVFQYDGDLRFSVLVFDKTACDKKSAFLARPKGDDVVDVEEEPDVVLKEEEIEEEKLLIDYVPLNGLLKMNKRRRSQTDCNWTKSSSLSSTVHLSALSAISPKQELMDSSGLETKGFYQPQAKYSRVRSRKRTDEETRLNKIILKAKQEFQYSRKLKPSEQGCETSTSKKPRKLKAEVNGENVSREGEDRPKMIRTGSLISQRRPVTEEEVESALQKAKAFTSTNPYTVAVMQEAYVYSSFFMSLPAWFAAKHLPNENTDMTVWDPLGRSWIIRYVSKVTHGALSGGWGKFSFANNLEKYDVCIFELIEPTQLRVHIFRVVDELTPLVRIRSRRQLAL